MADKALSIRQKKEFAKILFLNSKYNQKEIAKEVDIAEKTMSKWVNEEKWDLLKNEVNADNQQQIAYLNKQLNMLNEAGIKSLEDDDPTTNPDTQRIIMITKAIHYLRTKTSAGQMYETGLEFLKYLTKEDPELSKKVAPHFTAFIRQNLS